MDNINFTHLIYINIANIQYSSVSFVSAYLKVFIGSYKSYAYLQKYVCLLLKHTVLWTVDGIELLYVLFNMYVFRVRIRVKKSIRV